MAAPRTRFANTVVEVRRELRYEPDTGHFWWRVPGHSRQLYKPAGYVRRQPMGGKYIIITLNREQWGAHVLAWVWMTGEWPPQTVDHIDTNSLNNRWDNLRLATYAQQQWNQGISRGNTTGFIGVFYESDRQKWRAAIAGKTLGRFDTAEEAGEAYRQAALELYGEFVHTSLLEASAAGNAGDDGAGARLAADEIQGGES